MYKGNIYELVEKIARETGVPLFLYSSCKMVCCHVGPACEACKRLGDRENLEQELRDFAETCKNLITNPPDWIKNKPEEVIKRTKFYDRI